MSKAHLVPAGPESFLNVEHWVNKLIMQHHWPRGSPLSRAPNAVLVGEEKTLSQVFKAMYMKLASKEKQCAGILNILRADVILTGSDERKSNVLEMSKKFSVVKAQSIQN